MPAGLLYGLNIITFLYKEKICFVVWFLGRALDIVMVTIREEMIVVFRYIYKLYLISKNQQTAVRTNDRKY